MNYREKLTEMILAGMKMNDGVTEIAEDADLVYDLGYDSLSLVNLIVDIEETFNIEIDDDDLENIYKYGKLVSYITSKIEESNRIGELIKYD